ncbi:hypothetical protein ACQEVF_43235 [Nonomuraea polychroma]|uniref:hypothetical protein n=1 Tax=Nonomuraea polychroma TaxID=46176 RepID=UPI003D92D0AE
MTTPQPSLPPLLSAAAELLEPVGELPPLNVTCNVTQSMLAGILISPASLSAGEADQDAVVNGIATAGDAMAAAAARR